MGFSDRLNGGVRVQGSVRILGLGFRVQDFGRMVKGLCCMVCGLGFRVQGLGFMVQCLWCRVCGLGFRVRRFGFMLQDFWPRVYHHPPITF